MFKNIPGTQLAKSTLGNSKGQDLESSANILQEEQGKTQF